MSSQLTTIEQHRAQAEKWLLNAAFRNALAEASPRDYSALALSRAALSMIRADDYLAKCTPQSILTSVLICAQTGLLPGPLGFCALVPYKTACQWQLMYRGAVILAGRSGHFKAMQCEVVKEGDEFSYEEGSEPFVSFRRNLKESERGDPIAAFCSVRSADGPPSIRIMGIEEIDAIRQKYDKGSRPERPWLTSYDEMACKTVMKRTLKRLPMSTELATAIAMDDLADAGKEQQPVGPRLEDLPTEPEGGYCNADLGEGIVCSLEQDHEGDHRQ